MVQIQWGLAQGPNAFENALAKGYQMGSVMRERQEATERKNALAAYATDPNEQNFAGAAKVDPEFAIGERQRMEQRQAQEAQQRQQQMGTVRQLLAKAGQSPEGWAQAMSAAQSLGIDTSAIPQQYDPQWAQQQLFIMDALERDQDKLPGIAQELQAAGYEPGTPEFATAMRQVINSKYASDYVDQQGNTRRRSVLDLQGPQSGPQPGTIEEGYRFKGGNPSDPNAWEPVGSPAQAPTQASSGVKLTDDQASAIMMRAAQTGTLSASDAAMLAGTLGANGDSAFNQWVRANNIRIGN